MEAQIVQVDLSKLDADIAETRQRLELLLNTNWEYTQDGAKDVWVIFEGKVYDITAFIDEHPGGEEVLLDLAGADITQNFHDIGHSDYARTVMEPMLKGSLVCSTFVPFVCT